MASVVFLRAVNVGGHKAFQPSVVARRLADRDAVKVGAAGTFVIRGSVGATALRSTLVRLLPVKTEIMICSGRDVAVLFANGFSGLRAGDDLQRFVSVLARRPTKLPPLPLTAPAGADWQVKVVDVSGPFALSLLRRTGRTLVYPNEVVEKHLGVPATTRNWNTIATICGILEGAGAGRDSR